MNQAPPPTLTPRFIIAGPLPPPVHGFALATEGLVALLQRAGANPIVIDLAAPGSRRKLSYHLERARRVMNAALALVQERRLRGEPVRVHIACNGGLGMIYTMILALAARLAGCSLRLHHHSYASCSHWRPLMGALTALGGQGATHIVLRAPMAAAMQQIYGGKLRVATLSNAAFIPMPRLTIGATVARPASCRTLTIGLLGNLDAHKGLDQFLDLAEGLRREKSPVRGLLAGPIASWRNRKAVDARIATGNIEWLGPVAGASKSEFFHRIDVLIFPSSYVHEAEPLVVLEAMAHGVPVIASDRGCIRDLIGDAGVVISIEADFTADAMRLLRAIVADRSWLRHYGAAARRRFHKEHAMALRQAGALFCVPPPGPAPACQGEATVEASSLPWAIEAETGSPESAIWEVQRHA